jgi:acetoin utilization deacetylase AcuC-like enzyme
LSEFEKKEYASLQRFEAPQATLASLVRVHDQAYVEDVLARVPKEGRIAFDEETTLCPSSGGAALHAAGALCAAVDEIINARITNAFCAVRPPGHHAAVPPASGFCLFNNIAIGAAHALATHKLARVAIIDFDVHHGNGTQDWAEKNPAVLFISSHQSPLWPGSGRREERGSFGNIVNIPLPPGADGVSFRRAMDDIALPQIKAFAPEMIFISAGFDAHKADPLAQLKFEAEDFGWITKKLVNLAAQSSKSRIVSTLEGGYNISALAASAGAHVQELMAA